MKFKIIILFLIISGCATKQTGVDAKGQVFSCVPRSLNCLNEDLSNYPIGCKGQVIQCDCGVYICSLPKLTR
jgi:hypothetical protein